MRSLFTLFGTLLLLPLSSFAQTLPASAPTQPAPGTTHRPGGLSGPGSPFSPTAPVYSRRAHPNASVVTSGLLPNIKPLFDLHIRDTVVCLGGDGNYYLTGSTGDDIWKLNDGVELWRSPDLQNWTYLGLVWNTFKDGTWETKPLDLHGKPVVTIWAPEIHYLKHNYFICLSMAPGGISILKSTTGKPEGPYANTAADPSKPIAPGIDATLFEDDDGKVYFTNAGVNTIRLMTDDMSGFAETHTPEFADHDHDPTHHAPKCEARGMNDLGTEGGILFKAHGKYYLGAADSYQGRYSSCVAIADHIYGPYKSRHESVPTGGGTNFFQDKQGNWFCAYFGNDSQSPWREMPGIVKIDFDKDSKIIVAKNQPDFLLLH